MSNIVDFFVKYLKWESYYTAQTKSRGIASFHKFP